MKMRLFINESYGVWLGAYMVIQAHDEAQAIRIRDEVLTERGLKTGGTLTEVTSRDTFGRLIWDGSY